MIKKCETCKWWVIGDPENRIGNKGLCTWAIKNKASTPLRTITCVMISWEGEHCPAYTKGKPK